MRDNPSPTRTVTIKAGHVKIPDSADEAAAMLRMGAHWLQTYAPDVLQATMRATSDGKDAERYRWLRDTGAVFTVWADAVKGTPCEVSDPGRPALGLDAAIDAEMAKAAP